MVDDDVAQRADRVVEVAAVLDAEVLRHRDLHALDVVPVPDRLEHRVREPQVEDLLEAHLPEVVVDPEELRLVDVLVELGGQRAGRGQVVAERLLDDDARRLRQPGLGQALDDGAEEERRDLEVEDRVLGALDRLGDALVGRRVGEVALHVGEPGGEAVEHRLRRAARRCPRSTRGRARASWSTVQSSTATPTIGQSSSPRCSSRYSERNVITFARSPVIPKTTKTSAGRARVRRTPVARGGAAVVVISSSVRAARRPVSSSLRSRPFAP